ncbi:MAG: S41 family peptidase [Flavobacterium sp.]
MKKLLVLLFLYANFSSAQSIYQKDFEEFWSDINKHYAYLKKQDIDWQKVKTLYEPKAASVYSRDEFISFLESMINELYNGHSSLNTNLQSSNRLTPTGSDIYVEKKDSKYWITDIRRNSRAAQSGLKVGMQIVSFNDKPVEEGLQKLLPKFTTNYNDAMIKYAIDMLFSGTHNTPRKITVLENGTPKDYFPDSFKAEESEKLIEYKKASPTVGYIKINNSLGDNNSIPEFDNAVDRLMDTQTLIIDLTETPSGGNSTVARAIMSRFISKTLPYQQHEYDEQFGIKRSWVEYVVPRKDRYKGKVLVMVGHWTGSMGEGIAIGFDATKSATVIGTKMSGLLGAIDGFRLSETNIGFQFPTERLYHINGTPREDYIPAIATKSSQETLEKIQKLTKVSL